MIGHDLEPVGKLLDSGVVNAAADAAEPGNVLAAGQAREQFKVAGKVAGPAMDLDAVCGGVKPQEGGLAPVLAVAVLAAWGWWWTSRPRSGRGTRRPALAQSEG